MRLFSLKSYDVPIGSAKKHELMTHLLVGPRDTEMSKRWNNGGANRHLPVGVLLFPLSHSTSNKTYAWPSEEQWGFQIVKREFRRQRVQRLRGHICRWPGVWLPWFEFTVKHIARTWQLGYWSLVLPCMALQLHKYIHARISLFLQAGGTVYNTFCGADDFN